jgi:hypothetical protein
VGDSNLVVKGDQTSLITTTFASGLNFSEFKIIDSGGKEYAIAKTTEFEVCRKTWECR